QVILEGQGLELAGEDHRNAQLQAGHHRRGDARGLDGDDLGNALVGKTLSECVTDLLHQARIDLVIEKGIDLEYLFRQHDAFIVNFLFQRFHAVVLMMNVARTGSGTVSPDCVRATECRYFFSIARMFASASLPRAAFTSTGASSSPSQSRSAAGNSSRKRLGEQSMTSPYCLRLAAKVSARLRLARVMPT